MARSSSSGSGPDAAGGYTESGEWSVGIGYRHQFSFRHYVGDVEQKQRLASYSYRFHDSGGHRASADPMPESKPAQTAAATGR